MNRETLGGSGNLRTVFKKDLGQTTAILREPAPRQVFDVVLRQRTLLLSEETYAELIVTLLHSKFDSYVSRESRRVFLQNLRL
jgi:hypothetical protein